MTSTSSTPQRPFPIPPSGITPRSFWARLRLNSWRGRLAWVAVFFAAILVTIWLLTRMTPSWYRPLDRSDQNVIDTATRANILLQYELRNTVERVPLGEQRWSITQDEINSYLAINLAAAFDATASSKAPPISRPCVTFSPGKMTVSARSSKIPSGNAEGGVGTLVFSVGVIPGADGTPMGLVKLTGVWIGCLPVPKSLVQGRLQGLIPAVVDAVQEAIQLALGARNATQWMPVTEQIIRAAGEGQAFGLQYRIDRKDLLIKQLSIDKNTFTLVVSPVIALPAGVAPFPSGTLISPGLPAAVPHDLH